MLLSHGAERDGTELYEHVELLTPWRRMRAWSVSNPTGSWPELLRPGQGPLQTRVGSVPAVTDCRLHGTGPGRCLPASASHRMASFLSCCQSTGQDQPTVLAAARLATLSEFEGEWTAVMVDLFPMSDVRSDGVGLVKPFG